MFLLPLWLSCSVGDLGSIPGLRRSPGEGKGYPLQYFWPGEFHGLYSAWDCKESDTTEQRPLSTMSLLNELVNDLCSMFLWNSLVSKPQIFSALQVLGVTIITL